MEIVFFIAILAAIIALGLLLVSRKPVAPKEEGQAFLMLQDQINKISATLDTKLGESNRVLQQQFSESAKIIKDITRELTEVTAGNKQVKNIADQLKGLEDILKNPKQRGVLGEYYLKSVLENVFPPGNYQMQYAFRDGSIVDAVIFVKDQIIPIDSKFSLENYNRLLQAENPSERDRLEETFKSDLKNRIDETSKYIKPEEGTMSFAFMFIPSEAIYYDLIVNKIGAVKSNTRDLIEYAAKEKKVIIVSPTTLLAYLQTVLQGLKAMQIEESAKEIKKRVEELGKHLISYETYMKKLGNNLGTTVNMYNNAYKEFKKMDKDVMRVTGETINSEPMSLESPEMEDDG